MDKVDIEGFDGDDVILSVESFTTPDLKYMVVADFGTGVIKSCTCMDAICRGKIMDFTDGTGIPCKHMRAAAMVIRPFYEASLKGILKIG